MSMKENNINNHESVIKAIEEINFKKIKNIQPQKTKKGNVLTKNSVLEDFNQLYESLKVHPNIYHSNSKEILETKYKEILKMISYQNENTIKKIELIKEAF